MNYPNICLKMICNCLLNHNQHARRFNPSETPAAMTTSCFEYEMLDSNWDVSICRPSCHWGITVRENISQWFYAYRPFGCLCDTSWSNSLVWWQFTGRLNKKPGGLEQQAVSQETVASHRIVWAGASQTAAWKINLLAQKTQLKHPPGPRASSRHLLPSQSPQLSLSIFPLSFVPLFISPVLSSQPTLFRSIIEPLLYIYASKAAAVCSMLNTDTYIHSAGDSATDIACVT